MGENEHQSRSEWSIFGNDQENNLEEVLEPAPNCCIYRVPQYLRKINEEAYTPKLISIGPLHYGKKELMGMENQKKRYWQKFWERTDNAQKILEEFKRYVKDEEQHIRDHYSVSSPLQSSKYIAMILHDAVFIIELFRRKFHRYTRDFLLEAPLAIPITVDLLLLENQVPYFVLNDLYTIAFPSEKNHAFFFLSEKFFYYIIKLFNSGWLNILAEPSQIKHFTDFLRDTLVRNVKLAVQSNGGIRDLPNAIKLKGSGLKFKGIKEKCFLDINFGKREHGKWFSWCQVNELQIPCIEIYDETEGLIRNMMALEMFRYAKQSYICGYAIMMDYLIDTANDVDLLVEKKIIVNSVGDIEVIAKMFNRLCSHIPSTDSCYFDISEKMKAHYKYPFNRLKATLKSVYFSNLWTGTATVAATLLLILTTIQAVCSILQVI